MKHFVIVVLLMSAAFSMSCRRRPSSSTTTPRISVAVTGLEGTGLTLQLNGGNDLSVSANGTSSFNATLTSGTAYSVTVSDQPLCKPQTCTVTSGGTGTFTGTSVTVDVDCSDAFLMLASTNWGDLTFRLTNDLFAYTDGDPAVYRNVSGGNTNFGNLTNPHNLAFDRVRKLAYIADASDIKVYDDIETIDGNIAPDRTITITGSSGIFSLAVDARNDRLYVTGITAGQKLQIFNNASTLNGSVTPDESLAISNTTGLFLDEVNDHLYEWYFPGTIHMYSGASGLTSASIPTSTITMTENGGFANYQSLFVDGCNDRMVIAHRDGSTAGNEIAIFSGASTLSGSLRFDTDSVARRDYGDTVMNVSVDLAHDVLLAWADSGINVQMFDGFSTLSGAIGNPDRTIYNVVNGGYGMALFHY
jgi:hypothetical protein